MRRYIDVTSEQHSRDLDRALMLLRADVLSGVYDATPPWVNEIKRTSDELRKARELREKASRT